MDGAGLLGYGAAGTGTGTERRLLCFETFEGKRWYMVGGSACFRGLYCDGGLILLCPFPPRVPGQD